MVPFPEGTRDMSVPWPGGGGRRVVFSWLRIPKTEETPSPVLYFVELFLSVICIVKPQIFAFPDIKLFLYYFPYHWMRFFKLCRPLLSHSLYDSGILLYREKTSPSWESLNRDIVSASLFTGRPNNFKFEEILFSSNTERNIVEK